MAIKIKLFLLFGGSELKICKLFKTKDNCRLHLYDYPLQFKYIELMKLILIKITLQF